MLEAFIVTLREGVEAALIVGITLAYLSKINRPELRKSVYAALVSAFVGSLGVAALLSDLRRGRSCSDRRHYPGVSLQNQSSGIAQIRLRGLGLCFRRQPRRRGPAFRSEKGSKLL